MLLDWIDPDKLDYDTLPANPHDGAMTLLSQTKIEEFRRWQWFHLSENPNDQALAWLQENPTKVDWSTLSANTNDKAIALLKENRDRVNWWYLSGNSHEYAIQLLKENPFKISWYNVCDELFISRLKEDPKNLRYCLSNEDEENGELNETKTQFWRFASKNPHENSIALLKENPHRIDWSCLSFNSSDWAICQLRENPDKIGSGLSLNTNERAMDLLLEVSKTRPEIIEWQWLCKNTSQKAMDILYENQDKIQWGFLSQNPAIFYDGSYVLK